MEHAQVAVTQDCPDWWPANTRLTRHARHLILRLPPGHSLLPEVLARLPELPRPRLTCTPRSFTDAGISSPRYSRNRSERRDGEIASIV